MTLEQIVDLFSQAAQLARNQGLPALQPLSEALQQERELAGELMRRGLDLALNKTAADLILKALQSGKKPEEVEEACAAPQPKWCTKV